MLNLSYNHFVGMLVNQYIINTPLHIFKMHNKSIKSINKMNKGQITSHQRQITLLEMIFIW